MGAVMRFVPSQRSMSDSLSLVAGRAIPRPFTLVSLNDSSF